MGKGKSCKRIPVDLEKKLSGIKSSKEDLENQLSLIEKEKLELEDELFYQRFKDMSYLQIIKNSVNWKTLLIFMLAPVILSLFEKSDMKYFIMLGVPAVLFLATLAYPLENYQRIKYMKKCRKEK